MPPPGALWCRSLEKRYLFTPGPTPVPPEVLAASAEPMVHHRGADFREIYARTLSRLKEVYRTDSDVLLFTASGTGAMESAVANLTEAGEKDLHTLACLERKSWIEKFARFGIEHKRGTVAVGKDDRGGFGEFEIHTEAACLCFEFESR